MTHKLKIFVPLGLFCLVLLVDKIALIPAIRDAGRRESTPMENIALNLERLLALETIARDTSPGTYRPPVIFFGSSRSEMFQALHPDQIGSTPGLPPDARERLNASRYETRAIVRAADAWLEYVMTDRLLASGLRPEVLYIEVSPEMFNEHNPHGVQNRMGVNVYSAQLMWDLFWNSAGEARHAAGLRLLFLSYNYSLRPEAAVQNLLRGKTYLDNSSVALMLLAGQASVMPLPPDYVDFPVDQIPPDEYQKRFVDYTKHLVTSDILHNYAFSETQARVFDLMVDRLRSVAGREKIKVVFWSPPVHPLLGEARERLLDHAKHTRVVEKIKSAGFTYVEVRAADLNCKLWTDASHLSDRCAPAALQYLIDRSR